MRHKREAVCHSHKGRGRGNNEDNFYFNGEIQEINTAVCKMMAF